MCGLFNADNLTEYVIERGGEREREKERKNIYRERAKERRR